MGLNSLKTRLFTSTWQPEFPHGSTEKPEIKIKSYKVNQMVPKNKINSRISSDFETELAIFAAVCVIV